MKVIFLEDVAGAADAGEVKDVKNGFARNYLLPRGLAAPATPGQLQRIRSIEAAARQKRLQYSEEWGEVAGMIQGMEVPVEVRVGPNGRLFGSVTGRHIAEKLTAATGRAIDHRQVLLGAAIHEPGDYPVGIRLYREVTAEITVSVVPEGYETAQAVAADSEDDAPESDESVAYDDEEDDQSPDDDYDEDEDEPGDGITGEEEEP
ncbi:MAG: 50S ribosomal protein L9 [Chloroflexi bacterium]|nr:50S ribosomal protein L9 [Chloroflexota bacterium]